jgi:DNA-binding transcriptional LysR family regulator
MSLDARYWDLIAAYLAVRRHGSLSAAARALRLSQPTVRRQIEALEVHLGTKLFTRDPGGLTPSEAHDRLMAHAVAMESAAMAFARAATSDDGSDASPGGVVRLSCPDMFGVEVLPPILAGLHARAPNLTVELALGNQIDDLLRRDADIAVRLAQPTQAALVAKRIAPVTLGLYAAPGPLADELRRLDYATLAATAPFIGDDRSGAIQAGFQSLGRDPPRRIALAADSDLAQLSAIRAGIGFGVCQDRIASRCGLVRLAPEVSLGIDAFVVTHEDLRHSPRIRMVFDHLVDKLG